MHKFPEFLIFFRNSKNLCTSSYIYYIMPKIPKGKKRLEVLIDEETYNKLMELIKIKYQRTHGALSIEVNDALAHWLLEQSAVAHTKAHTNPGLPRLQQNLDMIIRKLKELGFFLQFTLSDWIKACSLTVGSDKRTWRKYLNYAIMFGRIKYLAGQVYEII